MWLHKGYIGIKKKLYGLFANLSQTGDGLCTCHTRQTELGLGAFKARTSCLSNAGRHKKPYARARELRSAHNKSHNGTTGFYQEQESGSDSPLHNKNAACRPHQTRDHECGMCSL